MEELWEEPERHIPGAGVCGRDRLSGRQSRRDGPVAIGGEAASESLRGLEQGALRGA